MAYFFDYTDKQRLGHQALKVDNLDIQASSNTTISLNSGCSVLRILAPAETVYFKYLSDGDTETATASNFDYFVKGGDMLEIGKYVVEATALNFYAESGPAVAIICQY